MVKQRMATADVAAEVASLRQRGIVGMRVTNIYDISSKVYVLKLARSGEGGDKILLLVESGARFHSVETMPTKSDIPSNFTLKLRKHIRTRRVESIRQLGVDRIVQLTFGTGDNTFYLILEFYAQGNVILTDKSYEVLTLLRSHRDDAKGMATMARHTYPIHTVRLRQPLAADALDTALVGAAPEGTIKSVLGDIMPFGPSVAEHCILKAGLDPARCPATAPLDDMERNALIAAVRGFEKWLDACEDENGAAPGGAILTRPAAPVPSTASNGAITPGEAEEGKEKQKKGEITEVYDEFEPLFEDSQPYEQHKDAAIIKFPSFDAAVSEFYGKIHGQRAVAHQAQREKAAVSKLDAIRRDHEARLGALASETEAAERRAALIELNLDAVDAALNAVREALAGGMDWRDLGRMIKEEKKAGNPVAALIDSLQLEKNKMTLLLRDPVDEEESDEEEEEEEDESKESSSAAVEEAKHAKQQKRKQRNQQRNEKVEVELDLTAYANARSHYDARKKHADKARRTLEANEHALAAAEKKAQEALAKVRRDTSGGGKLSAAAIAAAARKPYWFERFNWFISSENYLVLSGRDAQQNELLVKRYMHKGDVYVHADLHGASSTIIKNNDATALIPPLTLAQAGQACVCRSAAWDAKVVTSAYWVHPEQVSKTAPTGEYLTTGSFMIRGRKNYLPPQPLVMGLAWLFRLEEESVGAHLGERAPRLDLLDDSSSTTAAAGAVRGRDMEEEGSTMATGGDDDSGSVGSVIEDGADVEVAGDTGTENRNSSVSDDISVGDKVEESKKKSALDAFMDSSVDALLPTVGGASRPVTAAFDRYGLGDALHTASTEVSYEEESEVTGLAGGGGGEKGGTAARRHLSAKERQLLKKGGKGGSSAAGEGGVVSPEEKSAAAPKKEVRKEESKPSAMQKQQQQQRAGPKGKAARSSKKYADQDDEERELAMSLLQSAGQKKDRKQRKDERKAKMAARKAAKSGVAKVEVTEEDIAKLTARLEIDAEKAGSASEDEKEVEEGSASEEGEGAPNKESRAADSEAAENEEAAVQSAEEDEEEIVDEEAARKEREEVAELLAAEGVAVLDDADKERLTQLDELTGMPRAEDVVLYAVPMCAPYQVVAGYKYRVKLVPGTLKKGKAFRQGVELIAGRGAGAAAGGGGKESDAVAAAAIAKEKDLIRAVPEMDGINAMLGGVKLQVAGLQKMQQAKKKAAGKKKK